MQARAGAIDELIASGALDDASSINRGDDISRELESMSSQADVEAELAALKGDAARRPSTPPETPGRSAGHAVRGAEAERAGREGAAVMIVRILGEGQLEVADDRARAAQRARRAPSSPRSRPVTRTRSARRWLRSSTAYAAPARPLAEDSLEDSDLILPPADATHRRGPRAAQATTG